MLAEFVKFKDMYGSDAAKLGGKFILTFDDY
jgi:hypothetical protein